MNEIWKTIKGWEGYYQISNLGQVKSLARSILRSNGAVQTFKERLRRLNPDKDGYLIACLHRDGRGTNVKIHRLVAEAFIPNPGGRPTVNHKDLNKSNNRMDNLEWSTRKENTNHAKDSGVHPGWIVRNGIVHSTPVIQFTLAGEVVKEWPSCKEVERVLGYAPWYISDSAKKRRVAYGFKWTLKSECEVLL